MNLSYQQMVPADFPDDARVWIYQANRPFSASEALELETMLTDFISGWLAHGIPVKGFGRLFFGQFIVLMADERKTMVSGCSTDSSVRLIKDIERYFNVNLFDRQLLAFINREKVQLVPLPQLNYALENGFISGDTLYFNNTVLNKKMFLEGWLIPLKESWLKARLSSSAV